HSRPFRSPRVRVRAAAAAGTARARRRGEPAGRSLPAHHAASARPDRSGRQSGQGPARTDIPPPVGAGPARRLPPDARGHAAMTEIDRSPNTHMRIDVWLWTTRMFKTRSLATQACRGGHVQVDGQRVKASQKVSIGQEVRVRKAGSE